MASAALPTQSDATSRHVPVTIVGAGIGGLATAIAFARKGIDCVIIERDETENVRQQGYTLGIRPNGLKALGYLGCYDEFMSMSIPDPVYIDNKGRPVRAFMVSRPDAKPLVTVMTPVRTAPDQTGLRTGSVLGDKKADSVEPKLPSAVSKEGIKGFASRGYGGHVVQRFALRAMMLRRALAAGPGKVTILWGASFAHAKPTKASGPKVNPLVTAASGSDDDNPSVEEPPSDPSIGPEGLTITLVDGRSWATRLLVGADGVRSAVRRAVVGDPLLYHGYKRVGGAVEDHEASRIMCELQDVMRANGQPAMTNGSCIVTGPGACLFINVQTEKPTVGMEARHDPMPPGQDTGEMPVGSTGVGETSVPGEPHRAPVDKNSSGGTVSIAWGLTHAPGTVIDPQPEADGNAASQDYRYPGNSNPTVRAQWLQAVQGYMKTSGWHPVFSRLVGSTATEGLFISYMFGRDGRALAKAHQKPSGWCGIGTATAAQEPHVTSTPVVKSLVTFVGDAAHPMTPFAGQGANQALIDAVQLAELAGPILIQQGLGDKCHGEGQGYTSFVDIHRNAAPLAPVLRSFESIMARRAEPLVRLSVTNMKTFALKGAWAVAMRNSGLRCLSLLMPKIPTGDGGKAGKGHMGSKSASADPASSAAGPSVCFASTDALTKPRPAQQDAGQAGQHSAGLVLRHAQ